MQPPAELTECLAAGDDIFRVSHCRHQRLHSQVIELSSADQRGVRVDVPGEAGEEALVLGAEVGEEAGSPEADEVLIQRGDSGLAGARELFFDAGGHHEAMVMLAR